MVASTIACVCYHRAQDGGHVDQCLANYSCNKFATYVCIRVCFVHKKRYGRDRSDSRQRWVHAPVHPWCPRASYSIISATSLRQVQHCHVKDQVWSESPPVGTWWSSSSSDPCWDLLCYANRECQLITAILNVTCVCCCRLCWPLERYIILEHSQALSQINSAHSWPAQESCLVW